jgi:hypothetical protein
VYFEFLEKLKTYFQINETPVAQIFVFILGTRTIEALSKLCVVGFACGTWNQVLVPEGTCHLCPYKSKTRKH